MDFLIGFFFSFFFIFLDFFFRFFSDFSDVRFSQFHGVLLDGSFEYSAESFFCFRRNIN
ncbi:hypothetical protein 04086_4630 [Escherichia phage 04086]|nr:hypothetical protein 04086_4630 [Escherichia phage 04086]